MSRIIDGVQAIWKAVLSKTMSVLTAGASVILAVMLASSGGDKDLAQNRLDDAEQRIISGDSTMIITAKRDSLGETIRRDTLVRVTTETDLNTGMFRLKDTTSNGYKMVIVTVEVVDLLTGKDSVHYILASTPAIGTQWNMKIRQGKTEIAHEKIGEELDQLAAIADTLPTKLGFYPVVDTIAVTDSLGKITKTLVKLYWTTDSKQKPVVKDISVDAGTATEPIETIPDGTK